MRLVNRTKKMTPRLRTKLRIRKTVSGTNERPRLSVFKSVHHIYAQLISDVEGKTLVSASTLDKEVVATLGKTSGAKTKGGESKAPSTKSIEAAKIVGKLLAERSRAKKIENVVFDRNGFQYTGRVKAVSDGAREAGLKF
jgi:large subunit ribosomal protein L18